MDEIFTSALRTEHSELIRQLRHIPPELLGPRKVPGASRFGGLGAALRSLRLAPGRGRRHGRPMADHVGEIRYPL